MNTTVFKLPIIALSSLIFTSSAYAAASSTEATHTPCAATLHTYPLVQLSAEQFAVGRQNELIAISCKQNEPNTILATHPDYFISKSPDDIAISALTPSLESSNYIIVPKDPKKSGERPEDVWPNIEIKLAPTKHQSTIFSCARFADTVACVSPWYILLTRLNSKDAPEIIAHTHPMLIPEKNKAPCKATLGRFGSDNWMRCIALKKEVIATGQFDGSIFLWDLPYDPKKEPQLVRPRIRTFTESRAVKQLQFSSDGKTLFALNRHGLTKIILADPPQKILNGFRPKPEESAHFESMFFDEEHNTIYVGTASGSIYRYQLKLGAIELLTDLSGFSSPDKKINVIKKIGAMLYLGTNGGNLFTYDANRHPSMQKIADRDTSAICDLLPINTNELIISRQSGMLQKITLT